MVELERRGVEIRLGTSIASVDATDVHLGDGTTIPAHTVIWAAGVKANPLAAGLGLATTKRGEIEVGHDLTVPSHPEVFVIGDLAAATSHRGRLYPQLAPVAMQAGRHTAHNIVRRLRGKKTRAFHFVDKGTMATIGRRSAVAELPVPHPVVGHARVAELARPPPGVPHRLPQPDRRARQLDVQLLQVGPRPPRDPASAPSRSR